MFFVFSKQFRTEEKIISELIKKIKKSKVVVMSYIGDAEIYALDNLDISLDVVKRELVVEDKSGEKIMSMDGNFDAYDEMQQSRSAWFSEVLEQARNRYAKELATLEKQEKWKKSNENVTKMNDLKKEKQKTEAAMVKALDRIKSL